MRRRVREENARTRTEADIVVSVVIFGIEEAVKQAQNGGSGVVIYFRKEGRALGEVTKVSILCNSYHDRHQASARLLTRCLVS